VKDGSRGLDVQALSRVGELDDGVAVDDQAVAAVGADRIEQ
jgi:hypothetical protein